MKTTTTITGLLGKPQVTNRRTAMAEAIVYGTDGKTTHRLRGFALELLPQHLPVTVTGEAAEDGILVQELRLARPVDKNAYASHEHAMHRYAQAMQEYYRTLWDYRDRAEDGGDPKEPDPPMPKAPKSSYKALTAEYDRFLRKIAGTKRDAERFWEHSVSACLLDPALDRWFSEDKTRTWESWKDIPEEVFAEALYPYPVPTYALSLWRQPPKALDPSKELSEREQEQRDWEIKLYAMQRALTDACSAYWRYSILSRVLAGITVSQASLECLRGAGDDDLELLARAEAHIKDRPDKALTDQLFLDQKPEVVGQLLMDAGLSMADICELEATGKIPQGSASLPAYVLCLQLAHRAGHTVIDAKAVLDNAWWAIPKEYRGKVRLNSLVALRAAVGRSDSMLRYGVGGTAHGQEISDDSRYYRYGHVGLLGAIRAERTLARLVDSRRWAKKPEDARASALIAQLAGYCSPDQLSALQVLLATTCDLKILTGGPGTGKTTTLRRYLDIFGRLHAGARIALCAPTGRAAQRMAEQTGRYASTVHRLLEVQPYAGRDLRPRYTEADQLPIDLLVCDEASMLTSELAAMLLSAVPTTATILLIGDPDQLPAIGAGAVLRDLMAVPDEHLPKARLTTQHRSGDVIGINARAVLAGRICDGVYNMPQYRVFPVPAGRVLQTVLAVSTGQVLAPKYAGEAGIDRLNEELRKMRNPGPTVRFGRRSYAAGNPIIFTRNDYGAGYMNGDMGKVLAVAEAEMVVDLFGKQIIVSKADAEDIRPAYCISVHKAQGSEADDITIVLPADARGMVSRNLLYTAITRAKRSVTVICEQTETGDTYMDAAAIQAPPRMTLLPMLMAERLGCRIAGDDVLGEDRSYIERLREQLWQGQGKATTAAYPAIIDILMHALREDMKRVASD